MEKIFRNGMCVFILSLFLALPGIGFSKDDTFSNNVQKQEENHEEEITKQEDAVALEDMMVTATRTETAIEHIADSVAVITHEEIEMKGQKDIYEIIKDVPGISMKRCGGPGQWTYVRMRGGHNRHIKVLINGMSASDPRQGDFADYWSYLDVEDIERIEIVRGPQSALYGSEAISGVINIITKKGSGKPRSYIKAEGGSMNTFRSAAGSGGSLNKFNYNLTFNHDQGGGVFEHEEHKGDTVSGRFGYSAIDNLDLDLTLRYSDSWRNYNEWHYNSFKAYDDPRSYRDSSLFFSNMQLNHNVASWWNHTLSFAFTDNTTKYDDLDDGVLDEANNVVDSWSNGTYKGKRRDILWQHNLHLGQMDIISAGYQYEKNEGNSIYETSYSYKKTEDTFTNNSLFIHNQLLLFHDAISFTCGGRLDDHSTFGEHTTYKVGLAYLFMDVGLKLRSTHGTGFKAPNMSQLYDAQYGNSNLNPEESKSWDIGFEQSLFKDKFIFGATYFDNEFENLIAFDYDTYCYVNRDIAESHGIELGIKAFPLDDLSVSINYTYTDGKENDKDLALVPKHDWSANITYASGKFKMSSDLYYVDERFAYDQEHKIDEYTRMDISSSYQLNEHLNIFGRIENLFDEKYEESFGYPAPRVAAWGGVKYAF